MDDQTPPATGGCTPRTPPVPGPSLGARVVKILRRTGNLITGTRAERAQARLQFWLSIKNRTSWLTQRNSRDYLRMQGRFYELAAAAAEVEPGDLKGDVVVGYRDQQDQWPDYDTYLLKYVPDEPVWVALEYGCGPGRNIRKFTERFRRIDGVDISAQNLANAKTFLRGQIDPGKWPDLYVTGGADIGQAPRNHYDFCFSTICLQHICVYEVRFSILESLYQALKPGGRISIQMGFGGPSPDSVPYASNHYGAPGTNSTCDVFISRPGEVEDDLAKIGFVGFEYWIRPVGPGDDHPNWIFFTAVKPTSPSPGGG